MSFCRNLNGQKLIILQYDTVEEFVIILTGFIRKLNRMAPAKKSSEVCNFYIKCDGEIIGGSVPLAICISYRYKTHARFQPQISDSALPRLAKHKRSN